MRFLPVLALALSLSACDLVVGGDPTIGGTYSGPDPILPSSTVELVIPADTESDPDQTFNFTVRADGSTFTFTGTYEYPTLNVFSGSSTQNSAFDCTVSEDANTLTCGLSTGTLTATR